MNKKGKVKASSLQQTRTKAENVDVSYLGKNIALDLSFPYLFYFLSFGDFTNKFKTPRQYIEYFNYIHRTIFGLLTKTKCKSLFSNNNENFSDHSHTITGKEALLVQKIIKSLYIANGMNEGTADSWISQNIADVGLWQIGIDNGFGRIVGYFQDNIFKVILFDPHHLIYKTDVGKIRKYKDVSTFSFFPDKITRFEFPKKCIRCGNQESLNSSVEDFVFNKKIYICDKCLIEILEK